MMQNVYGNECLCRSIIYEWFKWLEEGLEDLNDDECSGRLRSAVNEENVEIVRGFIKKSRNLRSEGPKGQWFILSWCHKEFDGAHFDYQPFPVFTWFGSVRF